MNELVCSCAVTKLSWKTLYEFREWSSYISIKTSWIATGLEIVSSNKNWKKDPFQFPLVFNSRKLFHDERPNTSHSNSLLFTTCASQSWSGELLRICLISSRIDLRANWSRFFWTSCRYIWICGLHTVYIHMLPFACIKICINMKTKTHKHLWRCMNM